MSSEIWAVTGSGLMSAHAHLYLQLQIQNCCSCGSPRWLCTQPDFSQKNPARFSKCISLAFCSWQVKLFAVLPSLSHSHTGDFALTSLLSLAGSFGVAPKLLHQALSQGVRQLVCCLSFQRHRCHFVIFPRWLLLHLNATQHQATTTCQVTASPVHPHT